MQIEEVPAAVEVGDAKVAMSVAAACSVGTPPVGAGGNVAAGCEGDWVGGGLVGCASATNSAASYQVSRNWRHWLTPVTPQLAPVNTVIWLPVAVASTVNRCQVSWGDPAVPQTTSTSFHSPLPLGSMPARKFICSPLSEGAGDGSLVPRPRPSKENR